MSESSMDKALNYIPEMSKNLPSNDEKFLFFFEPVNVDEKFLFGLSLKSGVYIFSAITCIQALSTLFDIFRTETFWLFIVSIIAFIIYFFISLYACLGAIKEKYTYIKVSYIIIAVLFLIEALKYLAKSIYKVIEFITPWDGDFLKLDFLIYILGYGAYLFIYLYFIYILYRFMVQIKSGRNNNSEVLGNSENQNLIDDIDKNE